jgi:hypothetical protein
MSPFRPYPVRILSRTPVVRENYIFLTLLWLSLCRVALWLDWISGAVEQRAEQGRSKDWGLPVFVLEFERSGEVGWESQPQLKVW